jgi:hypothetical protein
MKRKHQIVKRVTGAILDNWVFALIIAVLGVISIGVLLFQLGSLVPGANPAESVHITAIKDNQINPLQALVQQPNFLPFTLGLFIMQLFSLESVSWLRAISVVFGLLSVASVYYIVSRWHTFRVSVFSALLYATSAGLLHVARLGDERSTYLLLPLVIAIGLYSKGQKSQIPKFIALGLAGLLVLYLPGTIWIAISLSALYYRQIITSFNKVSVPIKSIGGSIALIFVGLLTFSFITNPQQLRLWLGAPAESLPALNDFFTQLALVPVQLFAWGPEDPSMWVGTAGIIDIFVTVLFALGCYSYFYQRKLDRTKFLFVAMFVLILLAALGGPVSVFSLVPFIYIIAATGLALLLQQWFTVFPRNPFARGMAIVIIVAAISMSVFYNTHRYFIAWPRTPAVYSEFTIEQ